MLYGYREERVASAKTPVTTRIGSRQQGFRGGLTRDVGTARSMATDLARAARRSPVSRLPAEVAVWSPTRQSVAHVAGWLFLPHVAIPNPHRSVLTTVLFFVIGGAVVSSGVLDNLPDFAAICRDLQGRWPKGVVRRGGRRLPEVLTGAGVGRRKCLRCKHLCSQSRELPTY